MSVIKKLETHDYDVTKTSLQINPFLKNTGRDRMTYDPQRRAERFRYTMEREAFDSHGQPATTLLQALLIYGCGLYTAREQGIAKRNQWRCKFWQAHYFDYITFLRRAGVFGVGGGLVLGTLMFGLPTVAIRRIHSYYLSCTTFADPIDMHQQVDPQYYVN